MPATTRNWNETHNELTKKSHEYQTATTNIFKTVFSSITFWLVDNLSIFRRNTQRDESWKDFLRIFLVLGNITTSILKKFHHIILALRIRLENCLKSDIFRKITCYQQTVSLVSLKSFHQGQKIITLFIIWRKNVVSSLSQLERENLGKNVDWMSANNLSSGFSST